MRLVCVKQKYPWWNEQSPSDVFPIDVTVSNILLWFFTFYKTTNRHEVIPTGYTRAMSVLPLSSMRSNTLLHDGSNKSPIKSPWQQRSIQMLTRDHKLFTSKKQQHNQLIYPKQ